MKSRWKVTYRNPKSGALESLFIDASTRDEVFLETQKRRINPIRVAEFDKKKPMMGFVGKILFFIKGCALLLAIGAAVGLAFWFVFGTGDGGAGLDGARGKMSIEDVAPEVSKPSSTTGVGTDKGELTDGKELPHDTKPPPMPTRIGEIRNGYIMLSDKTLHKLGKNVFTNTVASSIKGKYEIFRYRCENEIACLLSMHPGEDLVGSSGYNGRFTREFLESLKTPIMIGPDDTEEQKELKRYVIQAKKDLEEAYDRGEDIEKIMLDTRKEYQDLANYKHELSVMVYEYKKETKVSEQDVEDYVNAANKMLEAKGIAPLKPGPLTRRKLMMQLIEERNK